MYIGRVKETFRVDVVLTPPPESDLPLVLAEVQFQREPGIYARLIASCAIMQLQAPEYTDVRMVIFFKNRGVNIGAGVWQPMVESGALQVVYVDEASNGIDAAVWYTLNVEEQASLLLIRLTVSPNDRFADDALAEEFGRVLVPLKNQRLYDQFRDYFVNLYLDKYNNLSLAELLTMIDSTEIFDDIGKSRAVREYAQEYAQGYAEEYAAAQVQKARLESALAMLNAGIPLGQVSNILGIPESDIESARQAT